MRAIRAQGPNRVWGWLLLLLLCSAGAARAENYIELRLDTGATWHHQGAVDGTVAQFLGLDRNNSEGGAEDTTAGISGEVLTYGADTPVRSTGQWGLAVGLFHQETMAPRLKIRAGLRLSLGQAEYFLKNGVAPFIDPITLAIDHVALTPELAFRGDLLQRGRWHLAAEAGAGLDLLRARTRVSSALLDVRRREDFRDLHFFGGLDAGYGAAVLNLRLRHSDQSGLHISLGQALRF